MGILNKLFGKKTQPRPPRSPKLLINAPTTLYYYKDGEAQEYPLNYLQLSNFQGNYFFSKVADFSKEFQPTLSFNELKSRTKNKKKRIVSCPTEFYGLVSNKILYDNVEDCLSYPIHRIDGYPEENDGYVEYVDYPREICGYHYSHKEKTIETIKVNEVLYTFFYDKAVGSCTLLVKFRTNRNKINKTISIDIIDDWASLEVDLWDLFIDNKKVFDSYDECREYQIKLFS